MTTIRKRLLSIMLVAMMAITVFTTPALAAGRETWSGEWFTEKTFTLTDKNTTLPKTMGRSGKLHVSCSFKGRPDLEPAGCPKVQVRMEIQDLNGRVLASKTVREDAFLPVIDLEIPVSAGQQYQIFWDVSSVSYNPNRNLRKADITYSHEIY